MAKNKKKSATVIERLSIWQQELQRQEGTTIEMMETICESLLADSDDPQGVLRKDMTMIRGLLKDSDARLEESGKIRKKTYRLIGHADLIRLKHESTYGKEKEVLLHMLNQMQGVLPEGVLEKVTSNIGKMYREQIAQNLPIVVAYEANIGMKSDMEYFYPMLCAIQQKQGLRIIRHALRKADQKEEILFFPEFLRQYKTLWYAFGVALDTEGRRIGGQCERIQLHLIDEMQKLPQDEFPFVPTGITDYLDEYFSDIIGVDNQESQQVMNVKLAVKNHMVERMLNNPLHESMALINSKDCPMPGYKLFGMQVKNNKELMRRLLEMGRDVVVLAPEKLRKEIRLELQRALSKYQ